MVFKQENVFRNVGIVVSKKDPAGLNIKRALLDNFDFSEYEIFHNEKTFLLENNGFRISLYTIEKDCVYADNIDDEINSELIVFATKHKSESKIPSLTAHAPGNFGKADLGGFERELCIAPSFYIKQAVRELDSLNTIGYDVVQEVTHHGPFVKKPVFFIEIGSTDEEWVNKEAGIIVAKALMNTLLRNNFDYDSAIGVGGLHTMPNFKKILLNTNIALGHVCAKYNLKELNFDILEQAYKKTIPNPKSVILDWKGLGNFKEMVYEISEELSLKYDLKILKTKNFV
ncbi:MAG: D-aminoacyl-tRNA deacylase [Candidatus Woesearchaeota archaeon]